MMDQAVALADVVARLQVDLPVPQTAAPVVAVTAAGRAADPQICQLALVVASRACRIAALAEKVADLRVCQIATAVTYPARQIAQVAVWASACHLAGQPAI